jgi:serine/threonine protein kinase
MRTDFFYLDPHLAAHVLHYLAKGLAASHRVNVFHRDLKPSNIMASCDPSLAIVKITDFGIAKMAEVEINEAIKEGEESITSSQTVVGALPYMAPELIESPTHASLEADVWSVGAMMYQLVSGRYPFGAGLAAVPKILAARLPREPALFATKAQFGPLTSEIWRLIRQCLCRDPKERPTADQLVEACGEICYANATRTVGRIIRYGRSVGSWGFLESVNGETVFFHVDIFLEHFLRKGSK